MAARSVAQTGAPKIVGRSGGVSIRVVSRRPTAAATIAIALVAVGSVSAATSSSSPAEVRFIDVGQGDGVVMRIGGKVIVSDAGQFNLENMDGALHALGADAIDVAILSHPHSDHVKNFIALVNTDNWKVHLVVLSHSDYWQATATNRNVIKTLKSAGAEIRYVVTGDHFDWGGADWEILNPNPGKYTDPYSPANASVVYRLRVRKVNLLFTGDIGPEVAQVVAARWTEEQLGRATVFLATHHGSAQGSNADLLAAIHPKWAVLSTGPNGFHHPTPSAIKRLKDSGASIWCTAANGTITAKISTTGTVTWTATKQSKPWWSATAHSETGSCVGR